MKLKSLPEDFRVDEQATLSLSGGRFAAYRLTKTGIGTPEAVDAICRRWNLPRASVSYGGLKDRHAVTTQHITIRNGPRRSLQQSSLQLDYLGQTARPFDAKQIESNVFVLGIRDLTSEEAAAAETRARDLQLTGMPNYFDRQRFGSVGESGEFIAAAACRGDYERAVWLALADRCPHDRSEERRQKELLQQHWHDWEAALAQLKRSPRRSVVAYLNDHPSDFRGAWARIRQDLRGLYLSALQSFLWNRLASKWLEQHLETGHLDIRPAGIEPLAFWQGVPRAIGELQRQSLPLPSARLHWSDEEEHLRQHYEAVLADAGWELREIRVKYPRDSFFSKGSRPLIVRPRELRFSTSNDELHPGRRLAEISFILPRGSYATILVKHLFNAPEAPHDDACDDS